MTQGSRKSVVTLRCMLALLVLLYASAMYCAWRPLRLSVEATQYRQLVWQTGSGFSLRYALQKVSFIVGSAMGLMSVILLFLRIRGGLILLVLCAPILAVATLLGAAPAAYPDVEPATTTLLWCAAAALWGATTVYAMLRRRELFERNQIAN
jgi:hypothetical protein